MLRVLPTLALVCLFPGTAHAGRSFYGWLYGTEVMPERGVELQTWIQEIDDRAGARNDESSIWIGPLIGVTDRLELSLPFELEWLTTDDDQTFFTFKRWGAEARYRFASPDPAEASPLVPLLRAAVKRDITVRDAVRVEADAVASYESGRLHALVDVGLVGDIGADDSRFELRPAAGVSVRVTGDLRLGAELYSELALSDQGGSWVAVGPNLAWTHGRFWLSGAFGIGVYQVKVAPRVMWGIAF